MWLKTIQILGITTVLFSFVSCHPSDNLGTGTTPSTGTGSDTKRYNVSGCCNVSEIVKKNISLLLMDDGYTGVIQFRGNYSNHSQVCGTTNISCNNKHCIVSFDTNETKGNFNKNFSTNFSTKFSKEYGIDIHKVGQSYLVYLLKNYLKRNNGPKLYFLPGNCTKNQTGMKGTVTSDTITSLHLNGSLWKLGDAIQFDGCVFNTHFCQNRTENEHIILFNATEENCTYNQKCVTCKNPVDEPKIVISVDDVNINSANGLDAAAVANVLKDLSSVLESLGKESSAIITMGYGDHAIEGILKKKEKEADFKEVNFGLTSDSKIKDIGDINALETPFPGFVSVPKEAFDKATLSSSNSSFVAVFIFPNMTKDAANSTLLNSNTIALEMGADVKNLTDMINITFINVQMDDAINMSCCSWNGEGAQPVWITDGCHTFQSNDTITCQCTHLTFFAILMASPSPGMNISSSDLNSLTYITYIGCGMSMFFLGVALFMHFLLRRGKANYTTLILINLFLAMFLLNLSFLSNEWVAKLGNPIGCKIMAAAMHYSMLSTFTWFAVEAFHLCLQFITSFNITVNHYILKVCIAGWALPSVVMSILFCLGKYGSLTINTDEKSVEMCWVIDNTVHYVVNIGYYAIVFLFTFMVFIVIMTRLTYMKSVDVGASKKGSMSIFSTLGLCCLLGITWGFAFFSYGSFRIPSYYIFSILNSFQGFFLFLYYYNTNKIVGEEQASSFSTQSTSTIKTIVDPLNPYLN